MDNSIVNYLNTSGQSSDFSSRKKLAEANGISNYMGSADQNISLLNTLKAKAPNTSTTPPAPTNTQGAITVDQMKTATPIKSVTPPVDSTNYGGIGSAATSSTAKAYEEINKLYQNLQTKNVTDATSISKTMEQLLGKGADTIAANETAGVNSATEDLNKYLTQIADINAQSSVLDKEASAIPLLLQEKVAGQGVTDAGLAPEQAGELRKNAIKRLELSAKADIVSAGATGSLNKLTLAKEKAQQIIDLKYKPLEDNLQVRLKQYELNKDILSTISKERTEALDAKLKEESTILSYYKDKEKAKSDLIVKAAPYAPASLLERAANAPDAQSAAIILGSYAGDYLAQQKLQQEIFKLQIENGTFNINDSLSLGTVSKDKGITIEDFKRGIAGTESAGSRDIYGGNNPYMVLSGQKSLEEFNKMSDKEKANTAFGKYQVMGFNIPSWTESAGLGKMTIPQFLSSPEAQEKVFEYQSELQYAKYGNWDDVASVWFSGKPASGNTNADKFGTNVPEYITKYRQKMGLETKQTQTFSKDAVAFSEAIDRGEYKDLNAIPEKWQSEVAKYRSSQPSKVNSAQVSELKSQLESVTKAKELIGGFAGLGGANIAGSNFLGRIDLGTFFSGDKATTLGYIDNILSGATLQKLIDAKNAGATFGALSNQELALLETSANVLNQWAIRDEKSNKLLGFNVPDYRVIEELDKLTAKYQKGINDKTVLDENTRVADDIFDMQMRTTTSTSKYSIFNN